MPTCGNNSHYFRLSTKGFEHSHPLSGVILRCLVCAALPTNDNKDDSVKGVVEMSEEMQDQEENIPAPLKGCCLHEKLVQDPEWLEAVGESSEACEDSLSLEQQLQKREDSCSTAPGHPMCHPIHFMVLKHGHDTFRIIKKLNPQKASSGLKHECNRTVQCTAGTELFPWMLRSKVTLLIHLSGSGQKSGSLVTCP